jgi:hypothetical protein
MIGSAPPTSFGKSVSGCIIARIDPNRVLQCFDGRAPVSLSGFGLTIRAWSARQKGACSNDVEPILPHLAEDKFLLQMLEFNGLVKNTCHGNPDMRQSLRKLSNAPIISHSGGGCRSTFDRQQTGSGR